jgi:hypothetical protein
MDQSRAVRHACVSPTGFSLSREQSVIICLPCFSVMSMLVANDLSVMQ